MPLVLDPTLLKTPTHGAFVGRSAKYSDLPCTGRNPAVSLRNSTAKILAS